MLPVKDKGKFVQTWNDTIALLGIDAVVHIGGTDYPVKCSVVKPKDEIIVNAYSEEVRVATLRKVDLTVNPSKFDTLTLPSGKEYVFNEVHEVHLNDVFLGWRCITEG